ncbi:hypothetical protein LTR36_004377 [Oleoguttula mirabilis]|uniref:Large ribosomal subunit protein bL27m n=1 Tax=Oleoguttula mirabilis TaxID=1507867 RepID=A0AAV9JFY7_9PEZI|nr:hypothetical protein LTR36_004377 [Oleoguttula mirabilis]
MAISPLSSSARVARAPSTATLSFLSSALRDLRVSPPAVSSFAQSRNASHQAQGRANGAKDGAGKRLGAKKTGGEYVIPGNILFKQRGTHWFPGDHAFMGRDHTIHAGVPGYVRYYRDPDRHPKRKYIGIVFEKDQILPQPAHAVRRRRLGMLAYQMPTTASEELTDDLVATDSPTTISALPNTIGLQSTTAISTTPPTANSAAAKAIRRSSRIMEGLGVTLRPGYQYRQPNHEIGQAAERKEAAAQAKGKTSRAYDEYKPGDRFAAWRKSGVRIARNNERRAMGRGKKGKK